MLDGMSVAVGVSDGVGVKVVEGVCVGLGVLLGGALVTVESSVIVLGASVVGWLQPPIKRDNRITNKVLNNNLLRFFIFSLGGYQASKLTPQYYNQTCAVLLILCERLASHPRLIIIVGAERRSAPTRG